MQECIPDPQEDVTDETVGKDHKEPVEGDQGEVHVVLPKVGHQPGQFFREEVLEHPLVHLEGSKRPSHLQPRSRHLPPCLPFRCSQSVHPGAFVWGLK